MAIDGHSHPIRLVSELPTARERFLSRVVDYAIEEGFRTPEDFLKHFPPTVLVESLAGADDLRVKLLVTATGMHEKIALKKSIPSAAEDLHLALEEQTTDPATLLGMYPPDDRVRYLDARKLWAFVTEDPFYLARPDDGEQHARAAARLTFMLDCAFSEHLITLRDLSDGITFDEIASRLPPTELQLVVKHALQIGRADAPLTEERLLAVVPLSALMEYVPLEHTWEHVIRTAIAVPCEFIATSVRPVAEAPSPPPLPATASPLPIGSPPSPGSIPPPLPSVPDASLGETDRKSDRAPEEDDARRRVMERLRAIDRLPPNTDGLPTPVLLSIESMYADLSQLENDEEREACVREAFPNESHLRAAMLALIELLDSTVDTADPVIHDADISGLVKLVLFEERRRLEMKPPHPSPAPSSARRSRRSVPPPLPKTGSGSAPPPLPDDPRRTRV